MTGLAAILDENARLRRRLAEQEAMHNASVAVLAAELAERDAKLEALQHKAEQLAQALELQRLQHLGPRSKRFIDDAPNTQTPLPFAGDFAPPPRALGGPSGLLRKVYKVLKNKKSKKFKRFKKFKQFEIWRLEFLNF
jgi:hypothetical protein